MKSKHNYQKDYSREMKLKTLKDLPISPLRKPKGTELAYLDWFKEQLKAEAIRWVKVYKSISKDADDIREKQEFWGRSNALIDFHNITSEDLK